MFFLDFNPSSWLSDGLEKVSGAARQVFNTICYALDTVIYKLIINLYNLFEDLCTSKILSGTEFDELTKRIGFILGMIMIFNVIFSFIKMLIEPDSISDKEKGAGSIVKKCIIVIVMLGMSSFAFNSLHKVQNVVIKNHVISRLLLPYSVDTDNFGAVLSEEVLLNFYVLNENTKGNVLYDHCSNYITEMRNQIIDHSNFELGYNCLNETIVLSLEGNTEIEEQEYFIIDFNHILSVVVGCAIVWILFRYCISVGIRVIQLTVLEIISPMAIISYLSPKKETMFQKWGKLYFATYIDAFIRIAIINFVIYICAVILDNWETGLGTFWTSMGVTSSTDPYTKGFIGIVMILALLTFAKKAPDLIKELLPAGASTSKIGFGMGLKDVVGLKTGLSIAGGAVGGAAVGLLAGRPLGAIGGALKGSIGGLKGQGLGKSFSSAWKNQSKANAEIAKVRMNGGNWLGHQIASMQKAVGMPTAADRYDDKKSTLEKENNAYNQLAGYFEAAKKRAESKIKDGKYKGNSRGQLAANAALQAENRIEILKQQAGNLDKNSMSDDDYRKEMKRIQTEITRYQATYNKAMDVAIKEFVNSSGDAVVAQNISMAQGVIDNNRAYEGFAGSVVNNFDSFEAANNQAKAQVSKNTTAIGKNAQDGKGARANAGR